MAHASRVEVAKFEVVEERLAHLPPQNRDKTLMGLNKEAQASNGPLGPIRTESYRVTNSPPLPPPSWLSLEGKSQDSRGIFARAPGTTLWRR